ncbi:MRP-like ABC transporter, partial [Globomyces pollinis-pini]
LKKSKIIMLDEATASVDFETDEYIQKAIRKDFSDATIVTIAHRLNTIADYDKVMVLSFGKLVEYDSPHVLLSNPTSEFSKMVAETGKANAELIRVAAKHIDMIKNK